jgi:hypothetical protein
MHLWMLKVTIVGMNEWISIVKVYYMPLYNKCSITCQGSIPGNITICSDCSSDDLMVLVLTLFYLNW